jgi:hypothetical protein
MNPSGQQEQSDSLRSLVEELQTAKWPDRIGVAFVLEGFAGEAGEFVEALQQIVLENNKLAKHTSVWLIHQIGKRTTERWKQCASTSLCPKCMVYCSDHKIRLPKSSITFYGCRQCCQSREFLDVSGKRIVVVLDSNMKEKYLEQGETLRVNWLIHRAMVDLDEVQIIQATDEDVERFAIQTGNDTDPTRAARYKEMVCTVSSDCHLSENTMRILEHTLECVKVKELAQQNAC